MKSVFIGTAAASVTALMTANSDAATMVTTYNPNAGFTSSVGDVVTSAFSSTSSYGYYESGYYIDSSGYEHSNGLYYPEYGNSYTDYEATVQAPTGRAVVLGEVTGGSNFGDGDSYGLAEVLGRQENIYGRNTTATGVLAAANGDTVLGELDAEGYGGTLTNNSDEGYASAAIFIADAPTVSLTGATAYLSTVGDLTGTSSPVDVQLGAASLSAERDLVFGFASPFADQIDMVGTLYLNGNAVGTFDDPLSFGAGNSTTTQSLTNDLTDVSVDFSGVTSPTANLELDYSIVSTAYDINGVATPTTLQSSSISEIVAVPEPASLSLISIAAAALLGRRRRLRQ